MPLETGTGASSGVEIGGVPDSNVAVLIARLDGIDRLTTRQFESLEKHLVSLIDSLRQETRTAGTNAEKAMQAADQASKEQLEAHNGLLRKMEAKDSQYATRDQLDVLKASLENRLYAIDKQIAAVLTRSEFELSKTNDGARFGRIEKFQNQIIGALILIGAIGVANLVKTFAT